MDIYNRKRRLGRWKSMDGVWFCRTKLGEIRPDSIESHRWRPEREKSIKAQYPDWGCIPENGRRQWHPTQVLLPGKSHGQRGLVGCSPWGCKRVGHD